LAMLNADLDKKRCERCKR